MSKRIVITGASGMTGSLVLEHCLNSDEVLSVVSLVRRSSSRKHQKLTELVVDDFLALEPYIDHLKNIDVVFYCQGVYTGAVDRNEFRKITVDYPEALANVLLPGTTLRFCLLSGAGADRSEKKPHGFRQRQGYC